MYGLINIPFRYRYHIYDSNYNVTTITTKRLFQVRSCHSCEQPHCFCTALYFQCPQGCIESSQLCDGRVDCSDKSDELHCNTRLEKTSEEETVLCSDNKTIIKRSYVDDFIHDCPGSPPSDEIKTIEQIKSLLKFHKLHCKFVESPCVRPDEVPCVPGHSKCFPINKLCVYDLDENGNLLYCRDGSHLKECVSFHCLHMFKCHGKLCIVIRV